MIMNACRCKFFYCSKKLREKCEKQKERVKRMKKVSRESVK